MLPMWMWNMATKKRNLTVERGRGATYRNEKFVVYEHSVYPRHSVLAGQDRRVWIEEYETLADAQRAYPTAVWIPGTTFRHPDLSHLSDSEG